MDANLSAGHAEGSEPEIVATEPVLTAVIRSIVSMDDIEVFYDRAFQQIAQAINDQGAGFVGPAIGLYWSVPAEVVDLEVGMPTQSPVKNVGEVYASEIPATRAAKLIHRGSYDGIPDAWDRLVSWMNTHGHQPGLPMWEVYVTEPTPDGNPDDMITELYCALEGP